MAGHPSTGSSMDLRPAILTPTLGAGGRASTPGAILTDLSFQVANEAGAPLSDWPRQAAGAAQGMGWRVLGPVGTGQTASR